jgi:hypothetical protein
MLALVEYNNVGQMMAAIKILDHHLRLKLFSLFKQQDVVLSSIFVGCATDI